MSDLLITAIVMTVLSQEGTQMKMIFSREQYKKVEDDYGTHKQWIDECDGKETRFQDGIDWGMCGTYFIHKSWCITKEDKPMKYTMQDFIAKKSSFTFDSPSREIHITTDGTTTHAILKENGKLVRRTKAVCSPKDTFDFVAGARLAMDRLMGDKPNPQYREVKREAKVGETIKITKTPNASVHKVGEVLTVERLRMCGCPDCGEGGIHTTFGWGYVVLEGYTEARP